MAYRLSTGDFQTDNYNLIGKELVAVTWVIWILAVLVLNIIMMNFIIAVISQSYERVMQKMIA